MSVLGPLIPFLLSACFAAAAAPPAPLPGHPGNVFLAGEEISVPMPVPAESCRLFNYEGKLVSELQGAALNFGAAGEKSAVVLGKLPVGYYRLELPGSTNSISLAVISPLLAPIPTNSPVGIDVAMAWFYSEERMAAVANLCALAGVNWVRDRLTWGQMEPRKGQIAGPNQYDASAAAQAQAGLRVLQVIHLSPPWANPATKRFPLDLRDAYRFYEAMARRWRGQVRAFEPWNEADIPMFGGHTGSEMASLQKAAYLGLKAGNPDIIACLNVFALHNVAQLQDLHANEAWPYFDTFNLHHYASFDEYPKLYADFRAVSAGRPLWVTECSLPVKWTGPETLQEPTEADLKVQSERVVKTFACSLHEGSAATFYFMLPHYVEGQTQFGILRPDLTPRPAYVALAAAGRLLAQAQPLGRLKNTSPATRAFLFRAQPDGRILEVLVAWMTEGQGALEIPIQPLQVLDHLGHAVPDSASRTLALSAAPVFALLSPLSSRALSIQAPPSPPQKLNGETSPIVLQALAPESALDLNQSAYHLSSLTNMGISVYAYNFGPASVRGTLQVSSPPGWEITMPAQATIAPQGRVELPLKITAPDSLTNGPVTLRVEGDFGKGNRPVLSLRLTTRKAAL